ncbi:RDD family protein [Streptomyces lomondensis]|uniref:RDD family protein n=1 Tax=Streptomyces lomondensis TaxID=68229 RepID=A0ABQ2WTT3_9ACTN|nr:RDD family protein [Streptomyces lomondensis]MCF0078455.1 RDD family protein [Streptomyces lomondensis]GGW77602.1 hypothetical protein GCM10010383_01080 [Streptomyces lomondensis]
MSAPTPAPGDDRPREGYYPDPSIPGYVRYWNGASWVPGTSRPAPKDGESLAPPPGAGAPAAAVEETGPHFFDEDPVEESSAADAQHGSRPEPASAWGADRSRQSGFGGDQDRRVSWGAPQGAQGADPRVAQTDRQPDGESARTDGTATIRPTDQEASAAAAGSTFVFRRPAGKSGGGAAPSADRPDEGTMTFRAVSPRTGPGASASGGDAQPAGPGGNSGSGGFGSAGPAGAAGSGGPARGGAGTGFGAQGGAGGSGSGAAGSGFGPQASGSGGSGSGAARSGFGGQGGAGGSGSGSAGSGFGAQAGAAGPGGSAGASGFGPAGSGGSGSGSAGPAFGAQAAGSAGSGGNPAGPAFGAQGGAAPGGAPDRPGFGAGKAAAARATAAQAGAAAPTALSGPQAAPAVPPQSGGPQAAASATPLSPGPGGGQSSWAQQVHRLAGAGGGDEQPVAPWKPPVDDPFQAVARRQAAARPAGLGKRLAARLLDTVVLAGLTAVAAVPLGSKAIDHVNEKIDAAKLSGETVTVWLLDGTTSLYLGIVLAVLLLAGVVSEVLPTAKWGRTLGKKLMGLDVRDIEGHEAPEFGAALRRWLVLSVPGLLVVGLVGIAWCLFDKPWRQGWHDKAAHTFVAG